MQSPCFIYELYSTINCLNIHQYYRISYFKGHNSVQPALQASCLLDVIFNQAKLLCNTESLDFSSNHTP